MCSFFLAAADAFSVHDSFKSQGSEIEKWSNIFLKQIL